MLRNYIKIAFRNFKRNKGFTAINIFGLSIGLATCLFIVLYVVDELSYDRYNSKAERIYRVNEDLKFGGNSSSYATVPAPMAEVLKRDFPEVESVVRLSQPGIWQTDKFRVKKDHESIVEKKVVYADETLFDVFTLPVLEGNAATALKDPNTVAITERTARKYFGRTNIVGEVLVFNDTINYKITAVLANVPDQSHFDFDFFLSMSSLPDSRDPSWIGSGFNTYVLLKQGANYKKLSGLFSDVIRKNFGIQLANSGGIESFEKNGNGIRADLSPLKSIHLRSDRLLELGHNGSMQYVYIFTVIAVFILFIACVNFMNLSTARSSDRAREVGIRKVLGSLRGALISQFLTESVLITFFSAVFALILGYLLLPVFNDIAGKQLSFGGGTMGWLLPSALVLVVLVGVITGIYPAFFISAYQPIEILKGKLSAGFKGSNLRSFLVVFQFIISIFLIIGTLVIYNQLHYIQTKNLGYERNQILVVHNVMSLGNGARILKQNVKQLHNVQNATMTTYLPTVDNRNGTALFPDPSTDTKKAVLTQFWSVDEDYVGTLGIKMAAGRNFSNQLASDSTALIINEAAARVFGFADPVNKLVYRHSGETQVYHVIGVMKDFNFSSLREKINPLVLTLAEDRGSLSVRVNADKLSSILPQIREEWKKLSSDQQFDYSFMDADFDANYRAEQRIGTICIVFTVLAIAIACLGIFGMAAYAAEQRSKEISIRKVLGASASTIITMLSKDFIKLVFIAFIIASPVAWFLMHSWLQDFAYRVEFHWWILPTAGLMALLVAFITISFQSIKAAMANPIKSLKSE